MALPEIDQVKDAALKYDKKALAKMVQMGQLSPTIATMAAMMRDRIVQSEMKPPEQATVVEEVFQPAMPQGSGLAAVPTNPQMFQGMAGGGIVAMAGGGDVPRYQNQGLVQNELLSLFESLPLYDPAKEMAGIPGAEMFSSVSRFFNKNRRIDPVTGKPVTFAEFMRLQDERSAAQNRPSGLQAAQALTETGTDTGIPSPSGGRSRGEVLRAMSPEEVKRAQALTDPTGGLARRAEDQARAEALEAAKPATTTAPAPVPAPAPGATAKPAPSAAKPAPSAAKPTAPAAPTGAPNFFSIAEQVKKDVTIPAGKDENKTYADVNKEMRDELSKAGYDFDLVKDQLAERRKELEELKGSRKEAANMRLLEAGLAILGGTSPYAFENIGKGAGKAMQGFQEDIKEIAKNRRELDKDIRQLQTLGNNEVLMMTTEGRKRYDTIQERKRQREQKEQELQNEIAGRVFTAENDKYLTGVRETGATARARMQAEAPGAIERIIDRANKGDVGAKAYLEGRRSGTTFTYEDAVKSVDARLKGPEGMEIMANLRRLTKDSNKPMPSYEEIRQGLINLELKNARASGREGFSATEVK
jgi:CRISPR/Cas system-associated protein Cas5 (RAMP superfamily)